MLFQCLTMFSIILGITQLHRQVEAVQGAPDLDAERAGVELIQGQAFCSNVDLGLSFGRALFLAWTGDEVDEDDQLAKADLERKQQLFERIGLELQRSLDAFDRQYSFISLPRLLIALRLVLGSAWLFLIAAEAIASTDGLGYRIFLVRRYLAMDVILPYVVWITLLAWLMDLGLRRLTQLAFPWFEGSKV